VSSLLLGTQIYYISAARVTETPDLLNPHTRAVFFEIDGDKKWG